MRILLIEDDTVLGAAVRDQIAAAGGMAARVGVHGSTGGHATSRRAPAWCTSGWTGMRRGGATRRSWTRPI